MPLQEESASQALAPSEVVLLNGDQFATPVPQQPRLFQFAYRGTRLINSDTTVSSTELLAAAISVALLAAERKGEVKLTAREEGNKRKRQDRLF